MFEKILQQIKKYDSIVLFGHIDPDPDCFGSQVALKESLLTAYPNKHVFVVGSGCPNFFALLGRPDLIDKETACQSLGVILDGNGKDRMEENICYFCKEFVKIDHHIETSEFSDGPSVVDTNSSSTCELIYRFLVESKLPITETVANALYAGILTDTGRFNYVNDYAGLFGITKELCSYGANPVAINKALNVINENELAFKGYILTHYKKSDLGILYILLNEKVLSKYKISSNVAHHYVNLLSNVKGYKIWLLGLPTDQGDYHYEIRSTGADIQKVAVKYGGGGHKCAAGYSIPEFSKSNFDDLLNSLHACLKE